MKRINDESDRYHTAIAAALFSLFLAGTFLLMAALALRVDVSRPAWYLGAITLVVAVVKVAGWSGWGAFFAWLRTTPWRERPKTKTVYEWKRAPLPPPEEAPLRPGQGSTFRPATRSGSDAGQGR